MSGRCGCGHDAASHSPFGDLCLHPDCRCGQYTPTCGVDGCTNALHALGWCRCHCDRHRRTSSDEYRRRAAATNQPIHGTRSRYRKGCRCDDCRRAETDYRRRYRKARR